MLRLWMMMQVLKVFLLPLAVAVSWAQPTILGVTNGASYSGNLAPGTWASIFGTQLAPDTATAQNVPLPAQLNGVSVTISGVPAPMRYVSPSQINVVIPFELTLPAAGSAVPVVVTTPTGKSRAFNVVLSRNSPGLFTQDASSGGAAWVFDANFNPVTSIGTDPIILYAAGLGPTNPSASSASGGNSSEPLNRIQDDLSVFVGDRQADILFAGLAPGFPGIYQLNVVPHGVVTDRVYLTVNGWHSNVASVPMASGSNVANVTGSIDGLYPSTLPVLGATPTSGPISYSVMLMAARFSTSFDIAPNAKPFSVVATSEEGAAVIDIDPVQGTWQATLSVPTSAARVGDFWGSEFSSVLDFTNCNGNGCRQFPNNFIPISYFDPIFVKAENLIPLPNLPVAKSPAAAFSASGTFSGTHFDTASTPLGAFWSFGGFIQIPHAGPSTRTATFRLYVDGVLITARDVNYPVL